MSTIRNEANRDRVFAEQLAAAETAIGLSPLRALRSAANTDWRAAAWLLERTCPERFARRKPDSLQPSEVRTLLDEVANIMADECSDNPQLERMCSRLDELQKARFGQYRSAMQGDPASKSSVDRHYDKLQREIEQLTGVDGSEMGISDKDVDAAIKWIEASDHRREEQEAVQAQAEYCSTKLT